MNINSSSFIYIGIVAVENKQRKIGDQNRSESPSGVAKWLMVMYGKLLRVKVGFN